MTEERKHAILFAATLLSARKIIEVIDNDDPQKMVCTDFVVLLFGRQSSEADSTRVVARLPSYRRLSRSCLPSACE
jgi:hypothetical protein